MTWKAKQLWRDYFEGEIDLEEYETELARLEEAEGDAAIADYEWSLMDGGSDWTI